MFSKLDKNLNFDQNYNFDRFETNLNIFLVLETQIEPRSNSNHILRKNKMEWYDSYHTGIILSLKIITIFDYSKPFSYPI